MPSQYLPHDHGDFNQSVLDMLPKNEEFLKLSDVFRQLGDCSRIRIFWILCHTEACVVNISSMVNMSSPAVSHHLRILKDSELISSRRVGKEVYYKACDSAKAMLLHDMIEDMLSITCPDKK